MTTYTEIAMTYETCWVCGITFGMPTRWHNRLSDDRKNFWCPAGCKLFYGKSTVTKLREQVEREQQKLVREREWHQRTKGFLETTERSLSATKGVVTRIKNRVAKGVCPCCKRSFPNLRRHMEGKHPEFENEDD